MIDPAEHVGLATDVATRYEMERRLPRGEALGDAWMGLLAACRRFKPEMGVKFTTYAPHVIRGYIIDQHRQRERTRRMKDGVVAARPRPCTLLDVHQDRRPTPVEAVAHADEVARRVRLVESRTDGNQRTRQTRPEIVQMLARGVSQKHIGAVLGMSPTAVSQNVTKFRKGFNQWTGHAA